MFHFILLQTMYNILRGFSKLRITVGMSFQSEC